MTPAPITPTRSERFASAFTPDADPLELISLASAIFAARISRGPPSTSPHMWRMPRPDPGHVLSQKITLIRWPLTFRTGLKMRGLTPKQPPDGSGALVIVLDADDVVFA